MASVAVKSEPTYVLTLDQAELDMLVKAMGDATFGAGLYLELEKFATENEE